MSFITTKKQLSRRDFMRLAALSTGGLLLASCGPAAPEGPGSSSETQAEGGAGSPKYGGTLTVGSDQALPQLDPHIVTFANERIIYPGLWNGLTEYNEDMEPVPALAESWEASDDLKTYTFKLRQGVKFHNGRELEAEDIKWNFERVLDPELGSQIRNNVQEVETIDVVDKYTVRMNLNAASVTLPMGVQELKIIAKESLENINKEPVGTGPYKFESFIPDESATLQRFEDYWGGRPFLDKVVITAIKDSTAAITALKTGQWSLMWKVPLSDAATLKDDPNVVLVPPKVSSSNAFWELDVTSPPFDNQVARQALSYATPRQQVVDGAYFGFGTPSITNNFVPEGHWAFNPDLIRYEYDLDKAKAMFAEAGITEGTELVWWTLSGILPEFTTAGEILAQSLDEIGIKLTIQQNEVGVWVDKFYPSGKSFPGMVIPNGDTAALDPAFPLKFFASNRCECNYNDPEIDEMLALGKTTADRDKRKEAYGEIQRIVNEQVPVIIPCSWSVVSGAQKNVKGAWTESGGQIHYESAWIDA